MDKYQDRYLEHIENKLKREQEKTVYKVEDIIILTKVMTRRKSIRRFNGKHAKHIKHLLDYATYQAPSSCNRHGIYLQEVSPAYAEKVLVGGKGWVGSADRVFFLFGAKQCYKNPIEIPFMPYLDAGHVSQNIQLMCEVNNIGCCFVNPNAREPVGDDYFCGAIAVGDY